MIFFIMKDNLTKLSNQMHISFKIVDGAINLFLFGFYYICHAIILFSTIIFRQHAVISLKRDSLRSYSAHFFYSTFLAWTFLSLDSMYNHNLTCSLLVVRPSNIFYVYAGGIFWRIIFQAHFMTCIPFDIFDSFLSYLLPLCLYALLWAL